MQVRALQKLSWQSSLSRPTAAHAATQSSDQFAPGQTSELPRLQLVPDSFPPVETEGWRLSDLADVGETLKQARAIVNRTAPFKSYVVNGNSGSGMTTLLKAMAGEFHARGTPTIFVQGAFLNGSVRDLFARAREKKAVIFVDGLDGLAPIRNKDHANQTMLQVAQELEKGDVQVIAGTSRTDMVDAEVMTHLPGLLTIAQPRNEIERKGIIDALVKRKGLEADPDELTEMAAATRGKGPSDLNAILDIAVQRAGGKKLSDGDLMEARLTFLSGPPEPITVDDRFFRISVAHEMGHVVTRHVFQQMGRVSTNPDELPQAIDLVSFHPRQGAQAFVNLMFGGNNGKTFEYYFAEMSSDYGGRAAEYFFGKGHLSAGPGGDLNHAEDLASKADALAKEAVSKGMGQTSGVDINAPTAPADVSRLKSTAEKVAYSVVAFYGPFIKDFANEMLERQKSGATLNFTGRELTSRLVAWERERAVPLAVLMNQVRALRDELRPAVPQVFDTESNRWLPASTFAEKLAF